jgi:F-type H+-transporting ATPase subunit delta
LAITANIAQQEKVVQLLTSPSLTSEQQVDALIDICGEELNDSGKNFLSALSENKRLSLLPEIYQLFAGLKAQQEKTIDVELNTAFDIDSATLDKLTNALSANLSSQVKLQVVVDESLIGGVVIRAGDTVIDSSVRGRLAKLAERLAS